jgi:hypothetical protein
MKVDKHQMGVDRRWTKLWQTLDKITMDIGQNYDGHKMIFLRMSDGTTTGFGRYNNECRTKLRPYYDRCRPKLQRMSDEIAMDNNCAINRSMFANFTTTTCNKGRRFFSSISCLLLLLLFYSSSFSKAVTKATHYMIAS